MLINVTQLQDCLHAHPSLNLLAQIARRSPGRAPAVPKSAAAGEVGLRVYRQPLVRERASIRSS